MFSLSASVLQTWALCRLKYVSKRGKTCEKWRKIIAKHVVVVTRDIQVAEKFVYEGKLAKKSEATPNLIGKTPIFVNI